MEEIVTSNEAAMIDLSDPKSNWVSLIAGKNESIQDHCAHQVLRIYQVFKSAACWPDIINNKREQK